MPTEIRLWKVDAEKPIPISQQKLDLESRLEDWIIKDITLISNDLLIIGRQVPTEYGGFIDILAMDHDGNLVILELKRDKTPITWEDLESLAKDSKVLPLYQRALQELKPLFDSVVRTRSNISLIGYMGENKSRNGIVSIFPGASSQELGLAVGINLEYLSTYFNIKEDAVKETLGQPNIEAKKKIEKFGILHKRIKVVDTFYRVCFWTNL